MNSYEITRKDSETQSVSHKIILIKLLTLVVGFISFTPFPVDGEGHG